MKNNKFKIGTLILSFGISFNISSMKKEIEKRENYFEDEQELSRAKSVKLDKNSYLKNLPLELKMMIAEFVSGSVNTKKKVKEAIKSISSFAQADQDLKIVISDAKFQEYLLNLVRDSFPNLSKLGAKILINSPYWADRLKESAKSDKALKDAIGARLVVASFKGNIDAVKFLLKAGTNSDFNYKFSRRVNPEIPLDFENTALSNAAKNGHKKIVELLLEAGADINLTDNDGDTALKIAARNKKNGVAKLLLNFGADPSIQNNYGNTALTSAVFSINKEMVKALLESGKDLNIDAKDDFGHTALCEAKHVVNFYQYIFPQLVEKIKNAQDILDMIKKYKVQID